MEQEEEVEEEEVCRHRLRNPGEDWEVSECCFLTLGGFAGKHKLILKEAKNLS